MMATQVSPATTSSAPGLSGIPTTELRLASGNGPISRAVLRTPLRDADPSEIPIIDISAIFDARDVAGRQTIAGQIRDAAMNNGFFYIKNHGIPKDTIEKAREKALE